jgi:hypothetical protein
MWTRQSAQKQHTSPRSEQGLHSNWVLQQQATAAFKPCAGSSVGRMAGLSLLRGGCNVCPAHCGQDATTACACARVGYRASEAPCSQAAFAGMTLCLVFVLVQHTPADCVAGKLQGNQGGGCSANDVAIDQ